VKSGELSRPPAQPTAHDHQRRCFVATTQIAAINFPAAAAVPPLYNPEEITDANRQ